MTNYEQIKYHEENIETLTKRISDGIKNNDREVMNTQKILKLELELLESLKENSLIKREYKVLIGGRGSGITSTLLLEASKFGAIYVCMKSSQKISFEKKCKDELNIDCPKIISMDELIELNKDDKIIIDLNYPIFNTEEKIRKYVDGFNIYNKIITVGNSVE